MNCCIDEEITTPFCPYCGKKVIHPLVSLLGHVARQRLVRQSLYTEEKKQWENWVEPGNEMAMPRILDRRHRKIVHKWQSWECALEELIEDYNL